MSLPWQKVSNAAVRAYRDARISEGRKASDLEALVEVQMLVATCEWSGMTQRQRASSLGWSRGRLARALDRWDAAGWLIGDGGPLADPSPDPSPDHYDHGDKGVSEKGRTTNGPPTDHQRTTNGPTRAILTTKKKKEKEKDTDHPSVHLLWEAWLEHHPHHPKRLGKGNKGLLNARLKESDEETCLLVLAWSHTAPDSWWRKNGVLDVKRLYRPSDWGEKVEKARRWDAAGRPVATMAAGQTEADLAEEATRAWARMVTLASRHMSTPPADQVHPQAPDKGERALSAMKEAGIRWVDLTGANAWTRDNELRPRFVGAYGGRA